MATVASWPAWAALAALLAGMLALDLGVLRRGARVLSTRSAALWSAAWVGCALVFALATWRLAGADAALEFTTAYLVEKALAMDNVFVIAVVFAAFAIPRALQHRVLVWGVLGALVMRAGFILGGSALISSFHAATYALGGLLVVVGLALLRSGPPADRQAAPGEHRITRLVRRVLPVSPTLDGERFFTRHGGRAVATPLFAALLAVEACDLIFALDSVPAVFAVSRDPFIVLSSNALAVLGLRSMYFLLADLVDRFTYLSRGLAVVLVFVGAKLALADVVKVPTGASLAVIAGVLAIAVLASVRHGRRRGGATPRGEDPGGGARPDGGRRGPPLPAALPAALASRGSSALPGA